MKYFVPKFQLGALSPRQNSPADKFGGLPWGLPNGHWPICALCEKSMALVAQLFHHMDRLDLGGEGNCLFIFMCSNPDSECLETWDSASGANKSFVIQANELQSGLSIPPDIPNGERAEVRSAENCLVNDAWDPVHTIWINTEVFVLAWEEHDDGIECALKNQFLDENAYDRLPSSIQKKVFEHTKLGSVPAWLQSPANADWEFLGQFSSFIFAPPLPSSDELGCPILRGEGQMHEVLEPSICRKNGPSVVFVLTPDWGQPDGTWSCSSPNYGDSGKGYIFRVNNNGNVGYEFIWQC